MSNLMKELKSEIARLTRKEIKKSLAEIKSVQSAQRHLISQLRKQIAALRKGGKAADVASGAPKDAVSAEEASARAWVTGKRIYKKRRALGLTQRQLAQWMKVSMPTIVHWEKHSGKIPVRQKAHLGKLKTFCTIGKREIMADLGLTSTKLRKLRTPRTVVAPPPAPPADA